MHVDIRDRTIHHKRAPILALMALVGVLALPQLLRVLPLLFNQMLLLEKLRGSGISGVLAFLLLHIIATVVGIPGVVLTVAGGLAFGLVWGSLWSLLGATVGAMGAFWTARYLFHDWAVQRVHDQKMVATFNTAIQKRPLAFVLMVRFAPISPFNVVNFLFGLTTIHWLPYSLGTLIGILPGVIVYTWLGVTGNQAMHHHNYGPLMIACALLALMSAIPVVWRRRRCSS